MSFFEAVTPLSERSGDDAHNFRRETWNHGRRSKATMATSERKMSVTGAADSRERKISFTDERNSRERRRKATAAAEQTEAFSGGANSRRASFRPANQNLSDDSFRSDLTDGGGGEGGGKRRSSKTAVALPQFYRGNHGEVSPIRVRPLFMTRYPLHRRLNAAAAASSAVPFVASASSAASASSTAPFAAAASSAAPFVASAASAGSHFINDPPGEEEQYEVAADLFRAEAVDDRFHAATVDDRFHAETVDEDQFPAENNEKYDKENEFERRSSTTTGRTLYSHVMHRVKTFGGGAGEECRRSSVIPEPLSAPEQHEQQQQGEQLQLQHWLDERQLAMWLEKIRRRKAYRSPFSALLPAGGGGGGGGGSSGASTGEERGDVSDDDDDDDDEHYDEDEDEETSTSFYTDAISATPSRMLTFLLPEDFEASAPIYDPFKSPQSGGGGGADAAVGGRRRIRGVWSALSETSS